MGVPVPADDLPASASGLRGKAVPADDLPSGGAAPVPSSASESPFVRDLMKYPRQIPSEVAGEFSKGRDLIRSSQAQEKGALGKGQAQPFKAGVEYLTGAAQELFAPLTGTVRAMVGNPIRDVLPKGKTGEVVARTAEDVAAMAGPSAVARSLEMVSKVLPSYNKHVRMLMDEGVKLTPGQIAQGIFKNGEDALRSIPGVGNIIASGQTRSLEDFNRAVINRSLKPIGKSLPKDATAGRDSIAYAERAIGDEYNKLIPKIHFQVDADFATDVSNIAMRNARTMPEPQSKQWRNVLADLSGRLNQTGQMDGRTWQEVDSELSYLGRAYGKSQDPAQRAFADAINDLRGAFRENLARVNPQHADKLKTINTAWAAFSRAQGASIRRVRSEGVFSPADLLGDIKSSTPRGVFARGDGMLQDLADAANSVLPQTVPDSGTATRAMWSELLLGGGAYMTGHPGVMAGIVAGSLPYTKPGMAVMNKLATGGPRVLGQMNETLPLTAPVSGAAQEVGHQE